MGESQFGKRYWAVQIKRTVLSLGIVFVLGILFDYLFTEDYQRNGLIAGSVAVALYIAATLALGLVNLASGIVYLTLWRGRDMQEFVLHDLRNAKLPAPDKYQSKRFDYLADIAASDEYAADIRVRAASIYSAYQVAAQRAGFFGAIALGEAANDAVLRYAQEAPECRPTS